MNVFRVHRAPLYGLLLCGLLLTLPAAAEEISVATAGDGSVRLSLEPQPDAWPPRVGRQALLSLEVNAHALQWLNVPQRFAQIEHRSAAGDDVRTFSGSLRIPGDLGPEQGGLLDFSEEIKIDGARLLADYELQTRGTVNLCGLQVSAYLDAGAFKGSQVLLSGVAKPPEGYKWEQWPMDTITVVEAPEPATPPPGMPAPPAAAEGDEEEAVGEGAEAAGEDDQEAAEDEAEAAGEAPDAAAPAGAFTAAEPVTLAFAAAGEDNWQLYDGFCSEIRIAAPQGPPVTIKAPGVCRFVIQDNRKWGYDVFEVRLAFVMMDEGQQVTRDNVYTGKLEISFGDNDTLKFTEPAPAE